MNKKGFTLVELLAVIAILAILVIVAMPNVLGMFNQAKANTFVTEVQKYMDNAKNEFIAKSMTSGGKGIVFLSTEYEPTDLGKLDTATIELSSATGSNVNAGSLAMDGAAKNYLIWLDRNGEFKRVIIYDANFCYDSKNADKSSPSDFLGSTPGNSPAGFDKAAVKIGNVVEVTPLVVDPSTFAYTSGDTLNDNTAGNNKLDLDGVYGCVGTTLAKTE